MTVPLPVSEPSMLGCDLCGEPLPEAGRRCPACGLYRGGRMNPSPTLLWRLAGAFGFVYVATIVVVLLAR
jgi:hypothetical protein